MIIDYTQGASDTLPYDIDFPTTLSSVAVEFYDCSDSDKTDLPAKVVATGYSGYTARVVLSALTVGKTYRMIVKGTCTDSNTYHEKRLVYCSPLEMDLGTIREGERRGYEIGLSDYIPSGVTLDTASASYTLLTYYRNVTTTTSVDGSSYVAQTTAVDRTISLDLENFVAQAYHVLTATFVTNADSLTSQVYTIVINLTLECEA